LQEYRLKGLAKEASQMEFQVYMATAQREREEREAEARRDFEITDEERRILLDSYQREDARRTYVKSFLPFHPLPNVRRFEVGVVLMKHPPPILSKWDITKKIRDEFQYEHYHNRAANRNMKGANRPAS
jgi:hypothetical protein